MPLVDVNKVERLIKNRRDARTDHDWAEVDRIREELNKMGVVVEENLETGAITWRVKDTETA